MRTDKRGFHFSYRQTRPSIHPALHGKHYFYSDWVGVMATGSYGDDVIAQNAKPSNVLSNVIFGTKGDAPDVFFS